MKAPSKSILHHAVGNYQYVLKKRTLNLAQMDRGQLMEALMNTMDLMKALSGRLGGGFT